ncbi:hypothetical protein [Clostridium perfringens]|nr:hypothetical protein [Clostridium perfringens]UBL05072.1 hypothetical protein KLF33_06820 [Clostridium perfringens]
MSKEEFLFRYKKDIERKKKKEEEIKQGINNFRMDGRIKNRYRNVRYR